LKWGDSVAVTYTTPGLKVVKLWVIDNEQNPSILSLGNGLLYLQINSSATLGQRVDNLKKKNAASR
jgi:hypothetical protein